MIKLFALALAVLVFPSFASAATYAYVNTSGEVRSVEASAPMAAISAAPGISTHSGVMLLTNQSDNDIVGDQIRGI